MGAKKLQKSIDTVKGDVRELVEAFWAFRDEMMTQQAVTAAERQPGAPRPAAAADLPQKDEASPAGHVAALGYYEMPDESGGHRAIRWALEDHPADELFSLPVEDAAKILAAIGHKQRLGIILLLLRHPATASEMVSSLSLGTTGAAYHHLNVLQGTGLVEQEQRGVFSIVPAQVPALLTIAGGLSGAIRTSVDEIPAEGSQASESADA